jgi:hypothetical protein
MTWDTVLVTVTLATVLLLFILLGLVSRIWQEETPQKRDTKLSGTQVVASRSAKIDKATEEEDLVA